MLNPRFPRRNDPESRLGLDSRDTVGGDWTLEFSGSGWKLVGDAALADRSKDQRAIARALQSFGPAGATFNDLIAAAGVRRDDVVAGLKTLVEAGHVVREESLAANGAGRPRIIYRPA